MVNSKKKGNGYELKVVNKLRALGFPVTSARFSSRALDEMDVDIYGMPMFNIQCKAWETTPPYRDILAKMPDEVGRINVIFHKKNRKGTIVVMTESDFYDILRNLILLDAFEGVDLMKPLDYIENDDE